MREKRNLDYKASILKEWRIDKSWTLFLDRDGTINVRLVGEYVRTYHEFKFIPDVLDTFPVFNKCFENVIIVTNQQGVGKEIMTEKSLRRIHVEMLEEISLHGGFIDEIYYCPFLEEDNPICRKPNIGMGLQAAKDFPEINFSKSIMVGDAISDMKFGKNLGMKTLFINADHNKIKEEDVSHVDMEVEGLPEFCSLLINHLKIQF